MPTPRIPDETVQFILDAWGVDPTQKAKQIHGQAIDFGHTISLRKVQQIISGLKKRGGGAFQPEEWRPWSDPTESPNDAHALLRLRHIWNKILDRPLYKHEALWSRRLAPALESAPTTYQILLILLYSLRESIARNLGQAVQTEDLDPIIVLRPWRSREDWEIYELNIERGHIPEPRLIHRLTHTDKFYGTESVDALRPIAKGSRALLSLMATVKEAPRILRAGQRSLLGYSLYTGDETYDETYEEVVRNWMYDFSPGLVDGITNYVTSELGETYSEVDGYERWHKIHGDWDSTYHLDPDQ